MRQITITLLLFLSLVIIAGLALKGWIIYQQRYICGDRVQRTVEEFLVVVRRGDYETLPATNMFTDKQHFLEIKRNVSNKYSLRITEWGGDFLAYVHLDFENGTAYALMLLPRKPSFLHCWNAEYEVLSIR